MRILGFIRRFAENYQGTPKSFYENFKSEAQWYFPNLTYNDLHQCGIVLCQTAYFAYADSIFDNLMQIFSQQNFIEGVISCITNKGIIFNMLGDNVSATRQYQDAVSLAEKHQKHNMLNNLYGNLAINYDKIGECGKAITYAKKALELFKNNPPASISCYIVLGSAYKNKGDFQTSIENYMNALNRSREISDKVLESKCLNNLSEVFRIIGDFERALDLNSQALELANQFTDQQNLSICLMTQGAIYDDSGDPDKALYYTEQSLQIAREIGCGSIEACCLENEGSLYYKSKDYNKSIISYKQALDIRIKENNALKLNYCYTTIIALYKLLGNIDELNQFEKKYANLNISYIGELDLIENNITKGIAARKEGKYSNALEYFNQSLAFAIQYSRRDLIIGTKINIGNVYQDIGKKIEAISEYKEALKICIEVNNQASAAICYQNMGTASMDMENMEDKALYYLKKSIKLFDETKQQQEISRSYTDIGAIYINKKYDSSQALYYLQKSLDIKKSIQDKEGEAYCYLNIGSAYFLSGDFDIAIEYSIMALEISRELNLPEIKQLACLNMAKSYDQKGEYEKAFSYCKLFVSYANSVLHNLLYEKDIIAYSSKINTYLHYVIPQCIKYGKYIEAFNFLENSKCISLYHLMAHSHANTLQIDNTHLKKAIDEEYEIIKKIADIEIDHIQHGSVNSPNELTRLKLKLTKVRETVGQMNDDSYAIKQEKSLAFSEIHEYLIKQDKNIVLIEYYCTSDCTYIFIVSSKEENVHVETVNISFDKITQCLEFCNKEIKHPSMEGEHWLELNLLVTPIKKYIAEDDIVYIIPEGILNLVPFHALKLDDKRLIENYIIVYSPSASLIPLLPQRNVIEYKSCIVYGIDRQGGVKEYIERNIDFFKDLFNCKLHIGSDALTTHLQNGEEADIMSFLCHGYFNYKDPLQSGLMLFDGDLTAKDIFGIKLNVDLVTSIACSSGENKIELSEDCMGLTRALLYAGASSVINCIKPVDAKVANKFMQRFLKHLKVEKSKSIAFRNAIIELIEMYPHPYYWIPFTLVGKW